MKKPLILACFFCAAAAFASSWSDSLAAAIKKNNHTRLRQLMDARPGRCEAVNDLRRVATLLPPKPDTGRSVLHGKHRPAGPWSVSAFEWALRPDFNEACFPVFERNALDSAAPETFRVAVLNVISEGAQKLDSTGLVSLHATLKSILNSSTTSATMKTCALRKVGAMPLSSYEDFSPLFAATDTTVRDAAYQGLIRKLSDNGHAGKKEENKAIFATFSKSVSQPMTMNQVRVIATFREDYSRDFLLAKCAGDAKKIAVAFIRDGDVRHQGLIAEASKLLRAEANPAALEKAVAQGVKDPGTIINGLLAGSAGNQKDGLSLMKAFPKIAVEHASFVEQKSQSSDPETKEAAQKLLPYLSQAASK
jgi:hypothetical protein